MITGDFTDTDLDQTRVTSASHSLVTGAHEHSGPLLVRGAQVGRYLVVDRLGAGGMGEVFSAYDPQLDRRIALKLVKFGPREDSSNARDRLLREAQALAKLSHPNVVAVYDAGTHGSRVFIAMEFVEGKTMRDWISEAAEADEADDTGKPHDRWREALGLMLQAGRGLAAAHAQGLVHRDFKPANIMVSDDGRVRVLDFGLARRFGELELDDPGDPADFEPIRESLDNTSGSRSSLSLQLTQTGMVMGTPSYMAPEQFYGGSIDERTDQFSFCVVLYRALFGIRPFPGKTFEQLGRAVARGMMREMPKASGVPRRIQAAVRQGLSVSRDERFPSMDDLLDELERGADRGRRRLLGATAGITLAAVVGGMLAVGATELDAAPPCSGAERKLEGVWDQPRREAVAAAFEATALPYAQDARAATERSLDRYAEQWTELHTEICQATRVRGDQSEALMDLRIGCLDDRLHKLTALSELLGRADDDVVKTSVQSVQQLPDLQECAAVDRDDTELLHPADPALTERVDRVREDTAEAWALTLAGKYEEAETIAQQALEAAREVGYAPAIAEAALTLGQVHERNLAIEPARDRYREALYAAAASGHAKVEAQALIGLLSIHGAHLGDLEGSLHYGEHAAAVVERLGNPAPLRSAIALYRGNTYMIANQLELALEQFEQAARLSRDDPAAERLHLAALNNMASVLGQQGRYKEAIEKFEEATRLTKARLGPWHPFVGQCLNNLGVTYIRLEDYQTATDVLEEVLAIYERALKPGHPELGRLAHNLGVVQSELGNTEQAYESYRKALAVKTAGLGPDHVSVALTSNNIGDALIRLGRPAEAIPYIEEALRIWTKIEGEDGVSNMLGLISLAEAHLALDQPERAEVAIRRALRLAERGELDPINVARGKFVAARVIWRLPRGSHKEALALARSARKGYRDSERPSPDELAHIDAWLADPQ